jgi:cytochrome P450
VVIVTAFPAGPGQVSAFRGLLPGRDMSRIPRFFAATAARYGSIASWPVGPRRFYLLNDPALIEELLVVRSGSFIKSRGLQRLERMVGKGLLTSNGAFHLAQRRLVQPAFHRDRIAAYASAMVRRADRFAAAVVPGETIAMDRAMYRLTLGIAAETLFGGDVDAEAGAIGAALDDAMATFPAALSPIGELLDHLPMLPVVARFRRAKARLDAILGRLIEQKRAALRAGGGGDDVLSTLLGGAEGEAMAPGQLRDEAMTIFIAGHETTADALAWAWWLLAGHPEVTARLEAEIDAVLAGRTPAADDVARLPVARAVIAEAMRLYPPAWVLGRQAIEPAQLGGWTVPAGGIVIASQLVMHREPRFWREPEAFRPERWWNGEADALPRFAYFPFGGGNRICIGEAFAWTEAVLVLATVARRLRFRRAPGAGEIATEPLVTLRPKTAIPLVAATRAVLV